MPSSYDAADVLRIQRGTPAGEPPVSTVARGLIGADNSVAFDAELLRAGNADHIAAVRALLNIPADPPDDGKAYALRNGVWVEANRVVPTLTLATHVSSIASWSVTGSTAALTLEDDDTVTLGDFAEAATLTISGGTNATTDTVLDFTGCAQLTEITCSGSSLAGSLDVTPCTALTSLDCSTNALDGLDVSGLTSLVTLDCSANSLTSLDLSGLTSLVTINAAGNSLLTADVDAVLIALAANGASNGTVDLSGSEPPSTASDDAVVDLQGRGWTITAESA
jgi:Leucine-rich repeat (LRR) protein